MTSLERARDLLVRSRIDGDVDDSRGYLDVLNQPDDLSSISLRTMQNPVFATVYERVWRPIFTRAFSAGGTATADFDRELVRRLGRAGDRQVLDVACGPGLHTKRLAANLTGDGLSIGLDFSPPMLARAVADNSGDRVAYVRGDAHRLPFADNTFDAVACLAALWLIPDAETVMDEQIRVCKSGGEVAIFATIATPLTRLPISRLVAKTGSFRIFGKEEITDYLKLRGLVEVEQTITGGAQYVLGRKP